MKHEHGLAHKHDLTHHTLPVLKLVDGDPLFQRAVALRDAVTRRAYELFRLNGERHGMALDDWLKAESELLMPTAIEVTEADNEITVSATLPGFDQEQVQVHVDPKKLILTAKHEKAEEEKKKKVVYSEYKKDELMRSIYLPVTVDPDTTRAVLHNGILKITMRKAEPVTARKKVAVTTAAAA
jgi:HSP20 family protein